MRFVILSVVLAARLLAPPSGNELLALTQGKPLLDAHNCYPYDGKWADRIDRALSTGFPVGIEQDIAPYRDPSTGAVIAKVSHRSVADAAEPTLKQHFFEHVRPLVERALQENRTETWPLIVVHFDFKDNSPATLEAVWDVLGQYLPWITTALKTSSDSDLSPFERKPLLVLTEENDAQERVFYSRLHPGDRLRLFGSAHTNPAPFAGLDDRQKAIAAAHISPSELLAEPATNYRRWWNNSWWEVEEGGQQKAGEWTAAEESRLRALVSRAHSLGYAIRFYTLDGFVPQDDRGWGQTYNFGSKAAVEVRWAAAIRAGVDLIATDQYEELRRFLRAHSEP